jgi:hypothetical protein
VAGSEVLEWTYQPWRESPGRAAVAAVAAFGLCVLILRLGMAPLTSVLLCVVTLSLVAPAFVPARCRIDATGVARRGPAGWTRRAWTDIRRARTHRRGLLVSPYTHPSWRDAHRAMMLPFPAARSEDLAAAIARHLQAHDLET